MNKFELQGQGSQTIEFLGKRVVSVEALNHDNTVRCEMHLYTSNEDYICHRIDRPGTLDIRSNLEVCKDIWGVYQFFGTEPLANYLYGVAGFSVPGMRKQ